MPFNRSAILPRCETSGIGVNFSVGRMAVNSIHTRSNPWERHALSPDRWGRRNPTANRLQLDLYMKQQSSPHGRFRSLTQRSASVLFRNAPATGVDHFAVPAQCFLNDNETGVRLHDGPLLKPTPARAQKVVAVAAYGMLKHPALSAAG